MKNKIDINKGRYLGAHCSIVGGFDKAVERASLLKSSAMQVFTKNSNQWKAKKLLNSEVAQYLDARKKSSLEIVIAHASYLINLSTIDPKVQVPSVEAMKIELDRAEALEFSYLVVHPGSHKAEGELVGIVQLVENLRRLLEYSKEYQVQILLETTAGQGASIGYDFEHFAEILSRLDWTDRIGICIDTAHIFEAGYDISSENGYKSVFQEFDEIVGLDYVKVFHLNDSKSECGSRVDRHAGIGQGNIGKQAFSLLLNDSRFLNLPMILETPKNKDLKEDLENLELLRDMI